MPRTLDALECELLRLPAAARMRLLYRLVASLGADSARDAVWDVVAASRDAEVSSGGSAGLSVDEVLTKLRAELR